MNHLTKLSLIVLGLSSAAALAAAPPGSGNRAQAQMQCISYGTGPMLACTVQLRRKDGTALEGAQVTLGALMPSMPMAHTIKPVAASPTSKPGEYSGTLALEMLGVWTVEVDISGPLRDKVSRSLMIDECPGEQRCAAPAAKTADKGTARGVSAHPPGHKH